MGVVVPLLEGIADGFLITDLQRRLVYLGGSVDVGVNREEGVGSFCGDLFQAPVGEGCQEGCILLEAMEEGFRPSPTKVECLGGEPVWGVAVPLRGEGGDPEGVILLLWEYRASPEAGNDLLCLLSHELSGYLTNIVAAAQTGLRDGGDTLHCELLPIIYEEAKGLSNLMEKMLRVSALEEGRWEPRPRQLVLPSLVSKVLVRHHRFAADHRFELWSQDGGLHVFADEEWTTLILNNLLDNARKHSPPGSHIKVQIQPLEGFALITVSDAGEGISPEHLPHIFDKFYRGEGNGFGLGLYLARRLVETQGGRIWAESRWEEGSKLHFTLPLSLP